MLALFFGYVLITSLGAIIVHGVNRKAPFDAQRLILSIALGLGLAGHAVFYTACAFNIHARWVPVILFLIVGSLYYWRWKKPAIRWSMDTYSWLILGAFMVLAGFLIFESSIYPMGGWDAWSCWNLKAKFLFDGKEHWRDMMDPLLWRSNTHYPLLLPTINVFFFHISGSVLGIIPQVNSIILTLLTAALLYSSITAFAWKNRLLAILITTAFFLIPLNILLGISQYSDILFALYLLAIFSTWLFAYKNSSSGDYILCGLFTGLLTFTKVEGMAAGGLMAGLISVELIRRRQWKLLQPYLLGLFIGILPTIVFQIGFPVANEAFTNGLVSFAKPALPSRLVSIILLTIGEMINLKWHCLWLAVAVGIFFIPRQKNIGPLSYLGIFFGAYAVILFGFYYVNTFFEIEWWIPQTLHRILFALGPAALLTLALGLSRRT